MKKRLLTSLVCVLLFMFLPSIIAIAQDVPEHEEALPGSTDNMLMLVVVGIVAPIVTWVLRKVGVADSLYASINSIFSVAVFVAWWYFMAGGDTSLLQDYIIRGLAAAGISGPVLSASGRWSEVKQQFKKDSPRGR